MYDVPTVTLDLDTGADHVVLGVGLRCCPPCIDLRDLCWMEALTEVIELGEEHGMEERGSFPGGARDTFFGAAILAGGQDALLAER